MLGATRASICLMAVAAAASAAPPARTIEPSGFATIRWAPAAPFDDPAPPLQSWEKPLRAGEVRLPSDDVEVFMVRDEQGIDIAAARAQVAQKNADGAEAMALHSLLRAREPAYVSVYLQRAPTLAWAFKFQGDGEKLLRKYSQNLRFVGKSGRYGPNTLEKLRDEWVARLGDLFSIASADLVESRVEIGMTLTEPEYRVLARARGIPEPPGAVHLSFPKDPADPPVSAAAAPQVRIFARAPRFIGVSPANAITGPVTLRDGCLYVGDALARFGRTMGLFVDAQGFLALRDRADPTAAYGRIGQRFVWSSSMTPQPPNAETAELREKCGDHPVVDLAKPSSYEAWRFRAYEVDALARHYRIGKAAARRRWEQCHAPEDRAYRAQSLGLSQRSKAKPCIIPGGEAHYVNMPVAE